MRRERSGAEQIRDVLASSDARRLLLADDLSWHDLTPELSRPAERAAARDHSSALAETAKRARLERIVRLQC